MENSVDTTSLQKQQNFIGLFKEVCEKCFHYRVVQRVRAAAYQVQDTVLRRWGPVVGFAALRGVGMAVRPLRGHPFVGMEVWSCLPFVGLPRSHPFVYPFGRRRRRSQKVALVGCPGRRRNPGCSSDCDPGCHPNGGLAAASPTAYYPYIAAIRSDRANLVPAGLHGVGMEVWSCHPPGWLPIATPPCSLPSRMAAASQCSTCPTANGSESSQQQYTLTAWISSRII